MEHSLLNTSMLMTEKPQLRMVVRFTAYMTAIIVLVLAIDWVFRSGTLPVEEIRIQGEFRNVSRDHVEQRIYRHVTGNYLVMNLDEIKRDIESMPWVLSASVRRSWPSGLHISFVEQELTVRWGTAAWLNDYGNVIRFVDDKKPSMNLPLITAPDGSEKIVYPVYQEFSKLLAKHGFVISKVNVSARRSWSITLENGITLLLGRDNINTRMMRFLDVYPVISHEQGRLSRIDLRYTNGFSVTRIYEDGAHHNNEQGSELKGQAYVKRQ